MPRKRLRRYVADFFIKGCFSCNLHNTPALRLIRSVLDEIDLQHFRNTHPSRPCRSREEMYQYVHESCVNGEAMDYLEFGVFQGDSIRCWAGMNKHADSRFYGFDSFEGLPERWQEGKGEGHFDVKGATPHIDDPRVKFVKGWFAETIPHFAREFAASHRLVMHLDADLYSSTMLPLLYFGPLMSKSTLLIFDEFYDREHEFKALMDWQKISGKRVRILAEVDNYSKVCAQLA